MCPICHLNLDSRQEEIGNDPELPIFQATQLMALAFGQGDKEGRAGQQPDRSEAVPAKKKHAGMIEREVNIK